MTTPLLSHEELLKELEIDSSDLDRWIHLGLIRPATNGKDSDALFTRDALDAARQIKSLLATGFDLPAVQKIVRKVGLPSSQGTKRKPNGQQLITVGELAEQTGLNPRTIRYWEERGIILPDGRSTGGFRLYSERTVTIIQLVRDLQLFGYTLEEIKEGADLLRDFFAYSEGVPLDGNAERVGAMYEKISLLEGRIAVLKQGIKRWEDLFRKHKKELHRMRERVGRE